MKNNKDHCCDVMTSILKQADSALFYDNAAQSYVLREAIIKENKIVWLSSQIIAYCPWCGHRLLSLDKQPLCSNNC